MITPHAGRPVVMESLHDLLAAGGERASRLGHSVLVCGVTEAPDIGPIDLFERAPPGTERMIWATPGRTETIVGVGAAVRLEATGQDRFSHIRRAWEELCADAWVGPAGGPHLPAPFRPPLLMGGFSFAPAGPSSSGTEGAWNGFGDALFTVPRIVLIRTAGASGMILSWLVGPGERPGAHLEGMVRLYGRLMAGSGRDDGSRGFEGPPAEEPDSDRTAWRAAVRSIIARIEQGEAQKVVLARRVRATSADPLDAGRILRALDAANPSAYLVAVGLGEHTLVSATPERLLALRDGWVEATCLAGSIGIGESPQEDGELGARLIGSAKDRVEHAVVVRAMGEDLAPVCEDLWIPNEPEVIRLEHLQHLQTPVRGRLREPLCILDLAARLHPSPAVGGYPREAIRGMIGEVEHFDRGWYAGPVGWVDASGQGELAVAIRSALLHGKQADLFAGCGIVSGSDPDAEYEESRLKLRPLLEALGRTSA